MTVLDCGRHAMTVLHCVRHAMTVLYTAEGRQSTIRDHSKTNKNKCRVAGIIDCIC